MWFYSQKIGNGIDTSFWDEVWRGDADFKSLYPRVYALESQKSITVAEKLNHENLEFSLRQNLEVALSKSNSVISWLGWKVLL